MDTPKGVVAVFITPSGDATATAASFEQCLPGGFTLRDAQKMRAKRRLAEAVAVQYCSPQYAQAMTEYDKEKTMNAMCNNGFKVSCAFIAYDEECGTE